MEISQIVFILVFAVAIFIFYRNIVKIKKAIFLGKKVSVNHSALRFKIMLRVALGQGKMMTRPIAGFLHIIVYVGFLIVNIEMLEIILDGIAGTHRIFAFAGDAYNLLIALFEWLALAVIMACIIFLIRRNILRIQRFHLAEMTRWPKTDANLILLFEILLMTAFLLMNAADYQLQQLRVPQYIKAGWFPISSIIAPLLSSLTTSSLIIIERSMWWFHILGVLAFLNYLPISKHFHIILAFPNTYYSKLTPLTHIPNMPSVTNEVKLMLDPTATQSATSSDTPVEHFGAKDITDLSRIQLLNAYSCTECGRCSSVCPANLTGKKLSPRKIMMDVRDRMEDLIRYATKHNGSIEDGKSLLGDYISEEEIFACTTCNACTEICPINIDPVSIIIDLRRYLVMEQSKLPSEWTGMLTNIENNGAPWQFSPSDRLQWANEN